MVFSTPRSGIELSKIPVRFSSYKTPFLQRLHLVSTLFSIHHSLKKTGQEVNLPARLVCLNWKPAFKRID